MSRAREWQGRSGDAYRGETAVGVKRPSGADLAWRIVSDDALSGAANMARDHALAQALRPGTGAVRFYGWSPATLSLGRNEPVAARYRDLLRRHPGIGLVRRPTGGRAVLHDRELTYAVALPARAFGGPRRSYRKVTEGLVAGLGLLGVEAAAVGGGALRVGGRALPPDAGPCFLEPAEGEVVVRGRKLVGSAQVRVGGAVLQHGSVLLVADQSPLLEGVVGGDGGGMAGRAGCGAGLDSPGEAPAGAITLGEVLGEVPGWDRLVDAFSHGFARSLGGRWSAGALTPREQRLAGELECRYGSDAWTWRRPRQG